MLNKKSGGVMRKIILLFLISLLNISIAQTTITIGTQVVQSGTTGISPYNYFWESRRVQFVYTASEIIAAGGFAGTISAIAFDVSQVNGGNLLNYTVRMAHTTATDASSHNNATLTVVKNPHTLTPGSTGWRTISFDNNFEWNGTDNILVDICWGVNTGYASNGQVWLYNNVANQMRAVNSSSTNQCGNPTTTARSGKPRVQFTITPAANMTYESSTTEQASTSIVPVGSTNQPVIRLKVVTSGSQNPFNVTSITFTTNGTTNTSDLTAAKVYYTTSPTFSTANQFGSTINNPNGTLTFTGSQQLASGNNYFWLAYDISSSATVNNVIDGTCTQFVTSEGGGTTRTPEVTDPAGSRTIKGPLSGNINVGTGQEYTSLTGSGGLFEAINLLGLSGNLNVFITSDLSEGGTNALNQWTEYGGSGYNLTIQPSSATVRTISGSYSGGLIRLNGADRVTIDGRYSGGGNYLNFVNTASSGTIAPLQIISLGTGQGAENVTIRNCTFSNGYIGTSTYGIFVGSSTLGTAAGDNDNLTIRDNVVKKSYYGIYVAGASGAVNDLLNILNNEVGSDVSSDYVYKYGIYVAYANNADISGNHIFNMSSTTATPVGLYVTTGVTNTTISKNKIHNIAYTGSSGYGGWGMYVNTGSSSSNLTIHNNVIYDIKGDGWSTFSGSSMVGIYIDGTTGGLNIYYNSVNLYGTFSRNTATVTAAMLFNSSSITNVDLRNNVFVNSMDNATVTTDKNYAIYSLTAASNFTNINYNDYFAPNLQGVLGYIGGSDKTTLADWQTATGQDGNSISANPMFVGDTDLRPSAGSPVLDAGTPIAGITTDFLGVERDANPSMGAYENPFIPTTPPNCAILNSPNNGATGVGLTPTLQWSDGGGGTTGYKLYFGTDNPPTNIHNGTDLGNVTSYTFSSNLNYLTTYYWKIVAYNTNGDASGCEVRSFTTTADPASIPSLTSFDATDFPPFGWTANPSSGTGAWQRSTSGTHPSTSPKSGAGMAYFNSYSYSSGVSGMLISPLINFPNDGYTIYFWMYRDGGYASNADRVDVYVTNTVDTTDGVKVGTINRSTSLPPTVASSGWYFYSFNLPSGTSGNKYIIICGRSAFGNNIFLDEVGIIATPSATSSQTISAGSTDPVSFGTTGTTIQFTTPNTGAVGLMVDKINSSPGGPLPSGVLNLAPVYWNIQVTSGTVNGTYSITLDVSDVPGVNNPNTVKLLKRSSPNEPWTNLGNPSSVSGNLLTWTGLTSFSDFGLGGDNDNPLPVQLSSFTASTKGRDVILNWTTATEVNTAGFEIERKLVSQEKAQSKWENVGFVRGNGNSNRPVEYTFTDMKLNTGKYAYRLKMVDNDGSYEYSNEVVVDIGKPDVTKIEQNYPNAFNPATKIEYQLANPSKVVIEVYNITGQKITELVNDEQVEGYYSLVFDASKYGLASGIYFYRMIAMDRVTGKNVVMTKKMLYLK
jgi:hypothetical protein